MTSERVFSLPRRGRGGTVRSITDRHVLLAGGLNKRDGHAELADKQGPAGLGRWAAYSPAASRIYLGAQLVSVAVIGFAAWCCSILVVLPT